MKKEIHPEYVECNVTCGCGEHFVTRSTRPTIRVEVCSKCHPFYTGKQKLMDSAGRIEKFQKRWGTHMEQRKAQIQGVAAQAQQAVEEAVPEPAQSEASQPEAEPSQQPQGEQ